ncbi:Alpha/Beta hydrolase protein [Syncephalis plumigaleata]|nr:Alpha/Beta hydrolase protein [Syncephalis plumigaleata]
MFCSCRPLLPALLLLLLLILLNSFVTTSYAAVSAEPTALQATKPSESPKINSKLPSSPSYNRKLTSLSKQAINDVKLLVTFTSITGCQPTGWNCGPRCEGITAGTQFIREFYNASTSTYAYVGVNDRHQRIIIAFRGTVNLVSVTYDADIFHVNIDWLNYKKVFVHRGFLACYNSIRRDITRVVDQLHAKYPSYTISAMDHSLGGALATLSALETSYRIPAARQQLITFGAPRIGNYQFATLVDKQLNRRANKRTGGSFPPSVRVINYNDIVPRLPFVAWSYYHSGPEIWISYKGNSAFLCYLARDHENDNCSNSIFPSLDLYRHSNFFGLNIGYTTECRAQSSRYYELAMDENAYQVNANVLTTAFDKFGAETVAA